MKRRLAITAEAQRDLSSIRAISPATIPHGAYMIFYSVTERLMRIRSIKHSATLK